MARQKAAGLFAAAVAIGTAQSALGTTGFDYLGAHQLRVNYVSAPLETTLPFSNSATGSGPSATQPYGEHFGEQIAPFQLHFRGSVRNGAFAGTTSSLGFTLDEATRVSITGTAVLLDGVSGGPPQFDVRVQSGYGGTTNNLIFFTTVSGGYAISEESILPAGSYSFLYGAIAPDVTDSASYDVVLTIPEPSSIALGAPALMLLALLKQSRPVRL